MASLFSFKQKAGEEPPRVAFQLVGRIVEKNLPFSHLNPPQLNSSFPTAHHRSVDPHCSPANLERESGKNDANLDKEKKKVDFDKLRESIKDSFTPKEIQEAQLEIARLREANPKMLEVLEKRGEEKLERSESDLERERDEGFGPPAGDWLESGGKIKRNILWEFWSERVEKIRICRFRIDGDIFAFDSPLENQDGSESQTGQLDPDTVTQRDLIRTKGDTSSIGYTFNEVVSLTRSVKRGQRVMALQLLSTILNKTLCNLEKFEGFSENCEDWQAIWAFALGPQPQIPFALRLAMDANHDSVVFDRMKHISTVLASAKTILSLLSHDMNEAYFEASQKYVIDNKDTCTAPVFRSRPDIKLGFMKGGFWKYNTKPSNLLPDFGDNENEEGQSEKITINDDLVIASQDVAAGLIRMSLLPRICYILEMDPVQNLQETLISILVALARHSPKSADAILKCPNLIQTVAKILRNFNSTAEIRPAQLKALILFKVLAKYNKQTCLDFMKNGIFQLATWTWYKDDFTLEKFIMSGKENVKLSSNLIVEQLRFWRVYINYGLCISHFTDFFSFMCMFLSPPIFDKLIDQNALLDFNSVAREVYLVLQTLAEKLPVLHNSEQISKREKTLEREAESWSWSHAVPMMDLALKWLDSRNIPILPLDKISVREADPVTLSSFLGVFSSIFRMLNGILEKIAPLFDKNGSSQSISWLLDFVPRLGLALINNGFGSLINAFINIRSNNENENIKNYDLLLASTSCLHGLVRVSHSIDKLVQRAKPSCTTWTNEKVTGGEILEARIINQYIKFNNLSEAFSVLTLAVSSNSRFVQSIEIFNRGGPAPGLGFGWGAPGGGFWSVRSVLTRLDSSLVLDLVDIFTVLPSRIDDFTTHERILKRINSVFEVCLTVGPQERDLLERAIEMLLEMKDFDFCVNYFIRQNTELLRLDELRFSEDQLLMFRDLLMSHFKTRWLSVKKKSENKDEKFNSLETIHEEIEEPLITEWAQQKLPVPISWILSPIFGTSETQISGLFLLLGFEAIASICNSISPMSHIPLVWKLHALSCCLCKSMDVLQEENSRGVFDILQGIYGREMGNTQNLDFEGEISGNYSTFLENLIDGFSADSFGDALYGRQVAVYLNKKVDMELRLNTWNLLASNNILDLLPPLENCIGGPDGYLGPIEDNDSILEAYVKSWSNGGLERAAKRKSVAFTIASYHLSCFIFQLGICEKQNLRNKLAKSLLRYHYGKPHNQEMLSSFIKIGSDASRQKMFKDEIARKFQILKDCCEGNSELLVGVEKLILSVS